MQHALTHIKAQLSLEQQLPMALAVAAANELMGLPGDGPLPVQVQRLMTAVGVPWDAALEVDRARVVADPETNSMGEAGLSLNDIRCDSHMYRSLVSSGPPGPQLRVVNGPVLAGLTKAELVAATSRLVQMVDDPDTVCSGRMGVPPPTLAPRQAGAQAPVRDSSPLHQMHVPDHFHHLLDQPTHFPAPSTHPRSQQTPSRRLHPRGTLTSLVPLQPKRMATSAARAVMPCGRPEAKAPSHRSQVSQPADDPNDAKGRVEVATWPACAEIASLAEGKAVATAIAASLAGANAVQEPECDSHMVDARSPAKVARPRVDPLTRVVPKSGGEETGEAKAADANDDDSFSGNDDDNEGDIDVGGFGDAEAFEGAGAEGHGVITAGSTSRCYEEKGAVEAAAVVGGLPRRDAEKAQGTSSNNVASGPPACANGLQRGPQLSQSALEVRFDGFIERAQQLGAMNSAYADMLTDSVAAVEGSAERARVMSAFLQAHMEERQVLDCMPAKELRRRCMQRSIGVNGFLEKDDFVVALLAEGVQKKHKRETKEQATTSVICGRQASCLSSALARSANDVARATLGPAVASLRGQGVPLDDTD